MNLIRTPKNERVAALKLLARKLLANEGSVPMMSWVRRIDGWFVAITSAGWTPDRLARYGLVYARGNAFATLYRFESPA
jgi:hypothetical protein